MHIYIIKCEYQYIIYIIKWQKLFKIRHVKLKCKTKNTFKKKIGSYVLLY